MSEIDAEVLRRHFVAIATSDYEDLACPGLPGVLDEVKNLQAWLCDDRLGKRRFTQQYPDLASNPTKQQVRDAFEEPEQLWNHSDAAVVFVTGHGVVGRGAHWIVLQRTDTGRLHQTALRTSELVGWLADTGIEHLLIILDLCYAGSTASEAAAFDADFPPTWLALASVTRRQQARTGALTTAISEFLAELASPTGEQFNHGPYLRVDQFLDAVQSKLGDDQRLAHLHPGLPSLAESPCLPNPRYQPEQVAIHLARRDLALRSDDLEAHWDPRSRGVATGSEGGWLFSGRTELMRRLIQASTGDTPPVIVTGAAGTGKSAVLARLVTLSDPSFCIRYAEVVNGIPQDLRPDPGAVDVAVLATGKVPHEVMGQIYEAVTGLRPATRSAVPTLDELRTAWWLWLETHDVSITMVVDALDEAKNPPTLLSEVLAQLNPPEPARRRVRLIVGVRSPGGADESASASDHASEQSLADLAEHELRAVRLRVDEAPWWRPEDLAEYATQLLIATTGSPYAEQEHHDQAGQVANTLAAKAAKSFLVTRIAATSLAHRETRIDSEDPAWQATLADGVLGVFRDDLHATLPDLLDRQRAVHLLRAVAFAYGRGLPWRQVWPLVANAVTNNPERIYGDSDIAWLLGSRLGAYLVADREDGITVYRLFHDALRSTLRERSHALFNTTSRMTTPRDERDELRAVEQRITRELTRLTAVRTIGGQLVPPPAYVRRHLAEHAQAGGILNDEVLSPQFLPYIDLPRLREVATNRQASKKQAATCLPSLPLLPVLRQISHLWDFQRPTANAWVLQMWAASAGYPAFEPGQAVPWRALWARWPTSPGEIVGRHTGGIGTVATAVLPDGRVVAVTGGGDDTVRVWDLSTGVPVGEPLTGHTGGVLAVATAVLPDGRVVAVTGGGDDTVRVWDLTTGAPIGQPLTGHTRGVLAVATAVLPDGRPVAVTGGGDDTVRVWDLSTSAAFGKPLIHHTNQVIAVATAVLPDGRPVAVTGSRDDNLRMWVWVRVWDLSTGAPVGPPLTGHAFRVLAVATAVLPDGRVVAVTGGGDDTVRVWDLSTGVPVGEPLTGHTGGVLAVATAVLPDGRVVAVTGGGDDTVRVWDLTTGAPIGQPLTGHTRGLVAVATAVLPDGRPVAVTGGGDATVRVWNLSTRPPPRQPLTGHPRGVAAVATAVLPDGRVVAVTGSWDDTVRVWNLSTRPPPRQPLTGHTGGVAAVATAVLPDGRPVAVTGSWDGELRVQVWDLSTGAPVGPPLTGHAFRVLAVATAMLPDGRVVAVTGGGWGDATVRVWDLSTGAPVGPPLTGHTFRVLAVATAVLPDGRPIAVTGSEDATVRVWDLTTRAPIGQPLTGHTRGVAAVATAVLPDGRPIAATGSEDATVRIWDLQRMTGVQEPLHLVGPVAGLSILHLPTAVHLVIAGSGITAIELRHQAL